MAYQILSSKQVDELIEYLKGTSKSLDEACNDLFEKDSDILTPQDHSKIDEEVFQCETCGWWSEVSELNNHGGENICDECNLATDDEEEEED